jgi:exodeoxyribonuclease VII large subunit
VGLVTALDSAAYNDVIRELTESRYAFRVVVCDARMQGVDGPSTVVRALRRVDRRGVDVIALVRGGGSLADLAAFDDERIARCIASLTTPVFTGIGHEVDTTVADHVAHTRHKTPTAVARALVEQVRDWRREAETTWSAVVVAARRALAEGSSTLSDHRRRTGRATGALLRVEARRLDSLAARASGPRLAVVTDRQILRLDSAARRLAAPRLATTLAHHAARLDRGAQRLHRASHSRLVAEGRGVEALAARTRVVDPVHTLLRGYSITRDASGRALRSIRDLAPGDLVTTAFADGTARGRVEETKPSEEET